MNIYSYIKPKLKDGTKEKRVIEIEMSPEEYEIQRKLWAELISGKRNEKSIDNIDSDNVVLGDLLIRSNR